MPRLTYALGIARSYCRSAFYRCGVLCELRRTTGAPCARRPRASGTMEPSYKRGFAMQAPLAILGFVFAAIAWWLTHKASFLVGGILLLSNWPWTIFAILPTNKALMAMKPEDAGPHSRALIRKWNQLHTVSTILGCLSVLSFVIALSSN